MILQKKSCKVLYQSSLYNGVNGNVYHHYVPTVSIYVLFLQNRSNFLIETSSAKTLLH